MIAVYEMIMAFFYLVEENLITNLTLNITRMMIIIQMNLNINVK